MFKQSAKTGCGVAGVAHLCGSSGRLGTRVDGGGGGVALGVLVV